MTGYLFKFQQVKSICKYLAGGCSDVCWLASVDKCSEENCPILKNKPIIGIDMAKGKDYSVKVKSK